MAEAQDQANAQQAAANTATGAKFVIQRIYVKDSSFEAPGAPEIFRTPYKPKVSFNMSTKTNNFEDNLYEVVLTLTAEVKGDEDKTMYIAEVQQAGIFAIDGIEGETLTQVLHSTCPNILYPYGREAVDSLANRGSFPALMLAPANFEAIYMQAKRQQAEQQAKAGQGDS